MIKDQEELEINKGQGYPEMKKEEITEDRGKDKQIKDKKLKDKLRRGEEDEVVEADLEKQAIKKKCKNNKKNKLKKK